MAAGCIPSCSAANQLQKMGNTHSIEVFQEGELVGRQHGLQIGKVFGESMFSMVSDVELHCTHYYVLPNDALIDCQRGRILYARCTHNKPIGIPKIIDELTCQPMKVELVDIYS